MRHFSALPAVLDRLFQSTHPHGVRLLWFGFIVGPKRFNPRTHTGCDADVCKNFPHLFCFNPRTHTGCDQGGKSTSRHAKSFNPRTHTGCDDNRHQRFWLSSAFQSTHPHGVRRGSKGSADSALAVSIHAPTRGATLRRLTPPLLLVCFNPRTHTGCDR